MSTPFRPAILTVAADPDTPPFARHGEPVTIGVTCPRGRVHRADRWALTDQRGRPVPVQTTTLDRWGDGSVRWLLVEFQADAAADAPSFYALTPDEAAGVDGAEMAIEHAGEILRVWTGAAAIDVPRSGAGFLAAAHVGGHSLLQSTAITAEDDRGARYHFAVRRTSVERTGPLRAVIRIDGALVGEDRQHWLDALVRLHFFGGLGAVKVELSITNPRAARHAGGCWDLGDQGSVFIRDLSIAIERAPGSDADVWASLGHTDRMAPAGERVTVYQDSSGGPLWQHATHANRDGRVAARCRGFRGARAESEVEGLRATPIVSIGGGDRRLSVTVPHFWELCPKSIAAEAGRCVVGMFPRAFGDVHELQGGERCTLTFGVCFGRDTVGAEPLAWMRSPLRVSGDPLTYRHASAWAPLAAGSRRAAEGYDALVNAAVRGPEALKDRREGIDEYGWRNFGDLHADHEGWPRRSAEGAEAGALVSHDNNQDDAVAGFLTRFLQTGDHRWRDLADDLAAHVTDIDLYHTSRDRAAYNGGYFRATEPGQPAGTATHRAYSRRGGSAGGGPSAEHNYTTGLMLHYFLSGCERSRAAVIQLANWVIDMDDGRKSRFRWLDRRETGLATRTGSPPFHGPGRGAANSINALVDAHRLTGEPRYLDKAEALIERSVHPDDDPAAIDPLNAEHRWSYTVFLQSLGKYLEHRADRGLLDEKFEYARAVLLRYAHWMCANERPYLATAGQLSMPTETWVAQDLRKAAVFEFAARHTRDQGARACFLARADGFVDYAVAVLTQSRASRLMRPLVLLLAYGFERPMTSVAQARPHGPVHTFHREAFVPLRQRLARKLAWAGAGISAAAFAIALLTS